MVFGVCIAAYGFLHYFYPFSFAQFCNILGMEPAFRKTTMFKLIQEQLYYNFKKRRKPLVLVIDEAQHLNTAVLNDLKLRMNFDYDSLNCFGLILNGEPRLNINLSRASNEALRQRITIHYEFQSLNPDEMAHYVFHKLKSAGGTDPIVSPNAFSALVGASSGNPW